MLQHRRNFDRLQSDFYIVKQGFTEVYNIDSDCGYSLETPHISTTDVFEQNKEKITIYLKIVIFKALKITVYCKDMLTICLPVSSADNLGKQFGPRSGHRA